MHSRVIMFKAVSIEVKRSSRKSIWHFGKTCLNIERPSLIMMLYHCSWHIHIHISFSVHIHWMQCLLLTYLYQIFEITIDVPVFRCYENTLALRWVLCSKFETWWHEVIQVEYLSNNHFDNLFNWLIITFF